MKPLEQHTRYLLESKERLERAEQELKDAKAQMEKAEDLLAEYMLEHGITKYATDDGQEIEVGRKYSVTIPKDSAGALAWLRSQGHGALIKHEFKVGFGKGESPRDLEKALGDLGLAYTQKETVHPSTMTKFAKEMEEDGEPVPDDLFNVFDRKFAKVTRK